MPALFKTKTFLVSNSVEHNECFSYNDQQTVCAYCCSRHLNTHTHTHTHTHTMPVCAQPVCWLKWPTKVLNDGVRSLARKARPVRD